MFVLINFLTSLVLFGFSHNNVRTCFGTFGCFWYLFVLIILNYLNVFGNYELDI